MNDSEMQILRVIETYKSAVSAKNIETFMHVYDPAVRVFDTWGEWTYEGAAAWQVAVEGWFASLGNETCTVSFDDVRTVDGQGLAAMSAIVTYRAMSAQGNELRTIQNRISWVPRLSGHVWRVLHEHSSAPIGFKDEKAIFKRSARK